MLGAAWFIREYLRGSFFHNPTREPGIYLAPSLAYGSGHELSRPSVAFLILTGRIDSYGSVDPTATMDID